MPGSAASAAHRAVVERIAVVGVGRAGEHQLDREARGAQPAHRRGGVEHALAAQHAGDQRER